MTSRRDTADIALERFHWRRTLRIVPAYAVFLALLVLLRREQNVGRWLIGGIAAVAGWRCVATLGLELPQRYVYHAFDTRAGALAVGCLLAVRAPRGRARGWWPLALAALLVASRLVPADYRYSAGFTVEAVLCGLLVWA